MERELDAVLERPLADLVQIVREDPPVRCAQVLGSRTPAEVGLESRDAEVRRELGVGRVVVERCLQLGGIEIFSAARHRGDADPRLVEDVLEDLGRLGEVLLQLVAPGLDPVKAELRRHLDAHLGMRLHWREHVTAHRPTELVAGKRVEISPQGDTEAGAKTGADEFATTQHKHLVGLGAVCAAGSPKSRCPAGRPWTRNMLVSRAHISEGGEDAILPPRLARRWSCSRRHIR